MPDKDGGCCGSELGSERENRNPVAEDGRLGAAYGSKDTGGGDESGSS